MVCMSVSSYIMYEGNQQTSLHIVGRYQKYITSSHSIANISNWKQVCKHVTVFSIRDFRVGPQIYNLIGSFQNFGCNLPFNMVRL